MRANGMKGLPFGGGETEIGTFQACCRSFASAKLLSFGTEGSV
jgi:hypothetical protein